MRTNSDWTRISTASSLTRTRQKLKECSTKSYVMRETGWMVKWLRRTRKGGSTRLTQMEENSTGEFAQAFSKVSSSSRHSTPEQFQDISSHLVSNKIHQPPSNLEESFELKCFHTNATSLVHKQDALKFQISAMNQPHLLLFSETIFDIDNYQKFF